MNIMVKLKILKSMFNVSYVMLVSKCTGLKLLSASNQDNCL